MGDYQFQWVNDTCHGPMTPDDWHSSWDISRALSPVMQTQAPSPSHYRCVQFNSHTTGLEACRRLTLTRTHDWKFTWSHPDTRFFPHEFRSLVSSLGVMSKEYLGQGEFSVVMRVLSPDENLVIRSGFAFLLCLRRPEWDLHRSPTTSKEDSEDTLPAASAARKKRVRVEDKDTVTPGDKKWWGHILTISSEMTDESVNEISSFIIIMKVMSNNPATVSASAQLYLLV